ncbi:hypothetical protein COOONC_05696, partial [Cooperia oncophora]
LTADLYCISAIVFVILTSLPLKHLFQRVLPHIAANVVSLSLLRLGGDFQSFLLSSGLNSVINLQTIRGALSSSFEKFAINAEKVLDDVLFLISAETIASRASQAGLISRAEQQLRATFLSRLNRDHIWEAVSYFLPKCPVLAEGSFGDYSDTSLAAAIDNVALNNNNGIVHRYRSMVLT